MTSRACPLLVKVRYDLNRMAELRMEGLLTGHDMACYGDLCRLEARLMSLSEHEVRACQFSGGLMCVSHGPQCRVAA